MKRPLKTITIISGIRNLLEEGEYANLARILRFNKVDLQKIYISSFDRELSRHMVPIYEFFNSGFITEEDAKLLLPAMLVSEYSDMKELSPYDVLNLPVNPLANKISASADLQESTLIAALHRGIRERDPKMIWTAWPILTPTRYKEIWNHSEFWRILLVEGFCETQPHRKMNLLLILKQRIEYMGVPSRAAINELIMINISLVAFYLDHLKTKKGFLKTGRVSAYFSRCLSELDNEFIFLFNLIKDRPIVKASRDEIFKGLSFQSTNLVAASLETLNLNPFYYEERIELFAQIIERLKKIPNVFADWFLNLFVDFFDVIPKMSLKLLSSTWALFLSFKPSIEGISTIMSWLNAKIDENYRLELAKMIPSELLIQIYRECEQIPDPIILIPFEVRESEYLKKWRLGTKESYVYDFTSFWSPNQLPGVLLLKVFQYFETTETISLDIFESFDTFFILESSGKLIHLRRFLEMLLNLFLKVKEWYISLDDESKEIIPSPLFPSQFAPFLAKIVVRCRHLLGEIPFKISDKYLMLSYNCVYEDFAPEYFKRFASSLIKYLMNSNAGHLPRLTASYVIYFNVITQIHEQQNVDFFDKHLMLYKTIRYLWANEQSEINQREWEDIDYHITRSVSKSLKLFGIELHNLMGIKVFADKELYQFLFK